MDAIALTQELIRCPSVTPRDEGALDVIQRYLQSLGFSAERLQFSEGGHADIDNLYAKIGGGGKHLMFAGHTDVVPPGNIEDWTVDPFGGAVKDGILYGRGAADMKSGIAAFAAASAKFLQEQGKNFKGQISFLITGDEEADAVNGTVKVLKKLAGNGEKWDAAIVGEPTSLHHVGDTVKVGRRGSLSAHLTVMGKQGHTAYPHLADNALHRCVEFLDKLIKAKFDPGYPGFEPATLQVTTLDVGNPAGNVIPAKAQARFNIRFTPAHSIESLTQWLKDFAEKELGRDFELRCSSNAPAFKTEEGELTQTMRRAIEAVTGIAPEFSTTGGTSDARFIKDYCPVVEFGLLNATIHKVDEHAAVADIQKLVKMYHQFLKQYFA